MALSGDEYLEHGPREVSFIFSLRSFSNECDPFLKTIEV